MELRRRGGQQRESGAFLLGTQEGNRRKIKKFLYYDDLDPHCLDTGIVVIDGSVFGKLWKVCRDLNMQVVADVHTHPGLPFQSGTDRDNPMIAVAGHVAIIVPNLARRIVVADDLGIYQYQGNHRWQAYYRKDAIRFFYIGMWS
jgi:proteasome lid subunit RPN8/RPN11